MTAQRDFKRVVRARMQKTGESYTAARVQVLRKKAGDRVPPSPAVKDFATLAGMTDAAIKKNTGCDWKAWVGVLDYAKAYNWPHRSIAEFVHEKYGVKEWWTQAVTVGYERIKGLREIGQRRGGSYEATKSRTFGVSVARLYGAFHKKKERAAWLGDVDLTVRKATKNRSMRITWSDGSSIQLWFSAKDRKKSQVAVQHTKLPDRAAAEKLKTFWAEQLEALAGTLADRADGRS
jgi:hypothetical protein